MFRNDKKFAITFFVTLFLSGTLLAQTSNSILTDNKLRSKLDTAIDYAVRIYLQDINTDGVSVGVDDGLAVSTYLLKKVKL
ncbi:MAG: hypothetical protein KDC49_20600 [Saprospiraceae bacterium]|nr:hypothetical protein [Saprospiraceae bacterium]